MDLKTMTAEELVERRKAIALEVEKDDADLDALEQEVRSINAELAARKEAAAKSDEVRRKVADGAGTTIEKIEERTMKDIKEFRNSKEYVDLYAEYMKSGDDTELRAALLTTNADSGTIPVPEFVEDIVRTAWDRTEIMSLVSKAYLPGNVKVSFEVSGSDAVVHTEGSGAVSEEELIEGIVTLVPEYVKKWKSFSKSVYALRGEAFVRYIYDELTYRILKKAEDELIAKIADLPGTATATAPAAATIEKDPAVGVIAEAIANLSDEAVNPVVVMNKLTWAEFKAAQYANQHNVDPFEGLRVIFNNSLPAIGTASAGDVYAIVGDFAIGALANFPNGEEVEFTFDTLTRKKENLVEVLGELMLAAEPVASKAFALLAKSE